MCAECDALEAELAELEVDALELATDITEGLVPAWARRGLLPHERTAGVNFAALDDVQRARADRLARLLGAHRDYIADTIAELLAGAATPAEVADLAARLGDPDRGLAVDVPGYRRATRDLTRQVTEELTAAYREGLDGIVEEAAAQARPAEVLGDAFTIPEATAARLEQQAATSAAAPGRVVVQQIAAEAARAQLTDLALEAAIGRLDTAARAAGADGLATDAARVPVQNAHARARVDALDALPEARYYYASELLDRNTCGPCSFVDGVRYDTLAAAEVDYPGGIYIGCQGGARCRGTLVAVWEGEEPPTIDDVDPVDRPEPPPPPAPAEPDPPADDDDDDGAGPEQLEDAPPITPPPDVDAELAAEAGVDVADVRNARAEVADLRRAARAEAAARQQAARQWFYGEPSPLDGLPGPGVGLTVKTPPKRRVLEDRFGRRRTGRQGAGEGSAEFDWLEGVDEAELRRLQRRGWFDPDGFDPDQWTQSINHGRGFTTQAAEGLDTEEAMELWRRHASLVDAAGAVARGKLPASSHIVGLEDIAPDLAADGWDLAAILNNDRDGILHVLAKRREDDAIFAERELFDGWRGSVGGSYYADLGPAPWRMSADSFRLELLDLEHEIGTARSLGQALDPVTVRRWHELVPVIDVDDAGQALDAATLHGLIVELARLAGL